MAPTASHLLPRQGFGDNDGDRDDDRNGLFDDDDVGGMSKWAIIGIVIAFLAITAIMTIVAFRCVRRRRKMLIPTIQLTSATSSKPISPTSNTNTSTDPSKYAGGTAGYSASADQNHSLLGNAEAPAIVMWEPPTGSTQDGFGYDNNLQLAGSTIQRPASIASFSAPPPRYEEATNSSSSAPGTSTGARPHASQGEAASYFNTAVSMGEDTRGRSRSRDPPAEGARARALSIDTRGVSGDRRRSMSRFREEGMVDVTVNKS